MKNLIIVLFALVVFFGCNNNNPVKATDSPVKYFSLNGITQILNFPGYDKVVFYDTSIAELDFMTNHFCNNNGNGQAMELKSLQQACYANGKIDTTYCWIQLHIEEIYLIRPEIDVNFMLGPGESFVSGQTVAIRIPY